MNKEQIINRIIEQEIYTGANQMIQQIQDSQGPDAFDINEEQWMALMAAPDLSEPPEGYEVRGSAEGWYWVNFDEGADGIFYDTAEEAIEAAFEDNRDEPPTQEVMQFWLVSDWLADKLEAIGAPVARDILGFNVWGRTECGQALTMDHHLNPVAALIEGHTRALVARAETGGAV